MGRGDVLQVMRFVEHQAAIGRQHGGLEPVVGRDPHREIGREQVVVHHDDVGLGGAAPRLEQEAALEVGTLEPRAQVRLRRDGVPYLRRRLVGQVREAAIAGARRPRGQGLELGSARVVEHRVLPGARLLEPRQAQIVAPPLEQREARRVVSGGESARQDRQVLADELLLQVDRVCGHDGALAVLPRPHERRHEVGERLANAGPRLEQCHSAVVVHVGRVGRHIALARPVLERAQHAGDGPVLGEQSGDVHGVEPRGRPRPRHLDHHVAGGDVVVHDREADAAVVQPGRDGEVGARRLEHAARVVVQQDLAALGNPRECEHRVHGAPRHDARLDDASVPVETAHERDFASLGGADFRAQQQLHGRRQPLDAHVFSSRFLAAGKSTLLRIRR